MIFNDVSQMLKNGFTHDEILEIFRGKTITENGNPGEGATVNKATNANADTQYDDLKREHDALLERFKELESRVNTAAVNSSEGKPIVEEEPDIVKVMESLVN